MGREKIFVIVHQIHAIHQLDAHALKNPAESKRLIGTEHLFVSEDKEEGANIGT